MTDNLDDLAQKVHQSTLHLAFIQYKGILLIHSTMRDMALLCSFLTGVFVFNTVLPLLVWILFTFFVIERVHTKLARPRETKYIEDAAKTFFPTKKP